MVKIRLQRMGSRNQAFYRIVALEEKKKRSGAPLDILGFWKPKKGVLTLDTKKLAKWRESGAVVTQAVQALAK